MPRSIHPRRSHFDLRTVENLARQVSHTDAAVHGPSLQAPVGFILGTALTLDQYTLGPFNDLPVPKRLPQIGVLVSEPAKRLEARPGGTDGRFELMGLDWPDQVDQVIPPQERLSQVFVSLLGDSHRSHLAHLTDPP